MTSISFGYRFAFGWLAFGVALLCCFTLTAVGQDEAPPLPEDKIVVDIDAPDEEVFMDDAEANGMLRRPYRGTWRI